jgi:deazaflavin-dependent oxidoreductase (nitroreductase family)
MDGDSGRRAAERFFLWFNRFGIPVLRSPAAPLFFNPVTGWACVVWTTGRRSGEARPVPLNYAIVDGGVCCLAGFGRRAHWYRNILADPEVTLDLPFRTLPGIAREITEPAARLPRIRAVLRAAGWAGWLFAPCPGRLTDAELLARAADMPLIEIRERAGGGEAAAVRVTPFDPGGRAWLPIVAGQALLGWLLAARLISAARRS